MINRRQAHRLVGARFARGWHAKGQCRVCGGVFPYQSFQEDPDSGKLRCRDCIDDPAPVPVVATDAIALHHPQPLLDTEGTEPVTQLTDLPQFWTTFGKYVP